MVENFESWAVKFGIYSVDDGKYSIFSAVNEQAQSCY